MRRATSCGALAALLVAACDPASVAIAPPPPPPPPPPPAVVTVQLERAGGDDQQVAVGDDAARPLSVRVIDSEGRVRPNRRIAWRVTWGSLSVAASPSETLADTTFTTTDANGLASVIVRGAAAGTAWVSAWLPDDRAQIVFFTLTVVERGVRVRFGPLFDCGDPYVFWSAQRPSGDVTIHLGDYVEWELAAPSCARAGIVAIGVPAGGHAFASGLLVAGDLCRVVPDAVGTWVYADTLNGGGGTITVVAP